MDLGSEVRLGTLSPATAPRVRRAANRARLRSDIPVCSDRILGRRTAAATVVIGFTSVAAVV
jgi:hypothetical protein